MNVADRVTFYAPSSHGTELYSIGDPASGTLMLGSGVECKVEIIPD